MTWLGRLRRTEQRVHLPVGSVQDLGESPLWPALAVLTAAGLYATLPGRFIVGSGAGAFGALRWIVPALTVVLIVPLALTVPRNQRFLRAAEAQVAKVRLSRRVASNAVIALITAANGISIILLVHLLVNGAHTQANLLLKAGIHLWITNVLVFALWFWQLDGGGPLARPTTPPHERDFLFPQQTEPVLLVGGWAPKFLDYLFVSFTNSSAFSPTDALPLSRWAKMLMLVQSAISLSLAVMVVARAVNILK
ncbi:MAG TPA: hypothetical protein VH210_07915 [Gaiellaceae bacterium]|nr:hypothetical protein [Gaiellaceae bacterium]